METKRSYRFASAAFARLAVGAGLIATCLACSTRNGGGMPGFDVDGGAREDAGASDAGRDGSAAVDAGTPTDAGVPTDDVIVWAHSARTLFAFDPRELVVSSVGDFILVDGTDAPVMTDLAVDSAGTLYACSRTALWRVDTESARATHLVDMALPTDVELNGLTFLPAGSLDAGDETLVGATDSGDYYRIDPETGATDHLGTYSNGYVSSGDIVSVEGAGTFATVKRDDLASDLLVRLDPRTGTATRIGEGIGFQRLFGLGYWRSRLFAFSADGALVEIDIETGIGSVVTDATGTDQFWGAGVTTLAPVGPF